jgi:uncharacterized membrane protein YgcG
MIFFVRLISKSQYNSAMKNSFLASLVLSMSLLSSPVLSQTEEDSELLGLPGDYLDLFAVLDLFQKSPTIEEFEKSLNQEETGVNNLDLNLDDKVDFIKVVTEQDGDDFIFILQVDVSETEIQDVAVILVAKDEDGKVTMQIVGDKDLYGEDYVVEPKTTTTPAVTSNPGYTGTEPVATTTTDTTTVVVVESTTIVQYVYSPVYVPYYTPYYYAYYPPYYTTWAVVTVRVYRRHHYHHHHRYHGGHHYRHTAAVHSRHHYNNYNRARHTSNTVNRNNANGNYNKNNVSNNKNNVSNNKSKGTSTTTKKPTTNQSMGSSRSRSGGGGGSRGGGGGRRR